MEISADTVKAIRELCDAVILADSGAQPLTMKAIAIHSALDVQERTHHGTAKPPGR